jgi:hypothetical protein
MMVDPITLAWLIGAASALALLLPLGQTISHAMRQWSYLRHLPSPPAAHWLLGESHHTMEGPEGGWELVQTGQVSTWLTVLQSLKARHLH